MNGSTFGRASGVTRGYIAHAAVSAVKATGKFGQDFAAADRAAYVETGARLAAQRAAIYGMNAQAIKTITSKARAKA